MTAVTLFTAVPAAAEENGYDEDPLGLVAGYSTTTHYSLGEDLWDVWICEIPEAILDFSPSEVAALFEEEIVPYFEWLSGGRYRPVFRLGGVAEAPSFDEREHCLDSVVETSAAIAHDDRPQGAVVIFNEPTKLNFGDFGSTLATSPSELTVQYSTYPNNARLVRLSGTTAAEPGSLPRFAYSGSLPHLYVVAHEIGHAIGFPHSMRFNPYDHEMDIMADLRQEPGLHVGTIAINRYAAGWMDPSEVEEHGGGKSLYALNPLGDGGTQMLVIRLGDGEFITLGARVRKGYDQGIPKEGVESYLIDQRRSACSIPDEIFDACWGFDRYTQAVIFDANSLDSTDTNGQVMGVGDGFTWESTSVKVVARSGDKFLVEVNDGSGQESSNRFSDDDGNIHEENIEIIAALGITVGCNPPDNDHYCPSRPVSRAEMAALMIRALGDTAENGHTVSRFSDVPQGTWYFKYVERLIDLGIVTADSGSLFGPSEPMTRLEMAVWMARGFDPVNEVTPLGAFSDVPADAWYAAAVEGLLEAGVTKGCAVEPPAYCPHDHVLRDQMASFFARVLAK